MRPHAHAVQFYRDEASLGASIVAGLAPHAGRVTSPILLIARRERHDGLAESFRLLPHRLVDAEALLSSFSDGAHLDAERFEERVGGLLSEAGTPAVVYGEMVDLLCSSGLPETAIALESMWNDLAKRYRFSLLCSYSMSNFARSTDEANFGAICDAHGVVLPTEEFRGSRDETVPLRQIALLQQRASALESEIAERRQLETELRRRELRYRTLVHANDRLSAVLITDRDGRVTDESGRWFTPLDDTRERPAAWLDLVRVDDRGRVAAAWEQAARGGEPMSEECRLSLDGGTDRWYELKFVPVHDDAGDPFEWVGTVTDIEDRRRADADARFLLEATTELNATLDYAGRLRVAAELAVPRLADSFAMYAIADSESDSVEILPEPVVLAPDGEGVVPVDAEMVERIVGSEASIEIEGDERRTLLLPVRCGTTFHGVMQLVRRDPFEPHRRLVDEFARVVGGALENARLFRQAQDANRAKDDFLATVSHELRTPLTSILGWASMLQATELDSETRRIAYQTIEQSARLQAALVDDLLDYARVVGRAPDIARETTDMAALLREVVIGLSPAAESRSVGFDLRGCDLPVLCEVDPRRMRQVATNLLSNAMKFSDDRSSVTLDLEENGDEVRLRITDSGCGIEPGFLPYAFHPFRQQDPAVTRRFGGLGLGLSIVKRIVELHGGSVEASSGGDGRGSSFLVTLPRNL